MKTLSTLVVLLLTSFLLSETALGRSDIKNFSNDKIQSLILGLNSSNSGLVIGSAILAGEYKIIETVEHLAKILDSDLTYEVKTAAVFALYQIQNREALAVLKNVCLKNNCPYLKKSAEILLNHYLICHPNEEFKVDYGVVQ